MFCKGCYARANNACGETAVIAELGASFWNRIFKESASLGVSFILLAGGEPLTRPDVLVAAAEYPEILFPVFTNGTMLTGDILALFNRSRNLVPVLSLEGGRRETDERRGAGTFLLLQSAMERFRAKGIFFGASVTVTAQNIEQVTAEDFITLLRGFGCKLVFYVEYVPADETTETLAPGDAERELLERRLAQLREENEEIIFLLLSGDEKFTGGCLAAGRGFFHINAAAARSPVPFPHIRTSVSQTAPCPKHFLLPCSGNWLRTAC